jgi:tetratricopeptide (TPR) repeat protein
MRDVLRDEYRASGNNQALAVRRAAAWWMTGDSNRYSNIQTAPYTQKVLGFYQQQVRSTSVARPGPQPSNYDRYMKAGYDAVNKKDYQTALINFRKALSERPNDAYATLAALNVETYIKRDRATSPSPSPSPNSSPSQSQFSPSAPSITQEQAVNLITEWLQAKQQIFAPPFARQPIIELTTGELYTDLDRSDGPIAWLKNNNAYYRFGVQKVEAVEQFVANGNKAAIEVRLTEDRTLYRKGQIDLRQTDFETKLIRYSLQQSADGKWKIADYKTSDGSVLERTVAN